MGSQINEHQHVNEFGEPQFVRQTVSNATLAKPVVMSFCTKCAQYIAATQNVQLLSTIEATHRCRVPLLGPLRDAA